MAYNTKYDKLGYAGWTYVEGKQRPEAGDTVIDSNAKTKTEEWFNTNLASYSSKIADGKYCNDRRVGVGGDTTVLSAELQNFWYAGLSRSKINKPTLSCDNNDIYTLKVGAITADEAMLAGGKYEKNESYYLFNGQTYWTLTPEDWYANTVGVFFINSDGFVSADFVVHNRFNIRPVINLKSDILFSGNGTIDSPYIVEGAE